MPGPTPARPVASARGTPAAVRTVSSARTLRPRWQPTRLLDLPEDVLVTAFALWPAESLACASVTCRELHAILDMAVALGVARLGYDALPPPRGTHDTRTHRLRHLQRLAARRPQTLSAGATTSLCVVGSSMVLAWGGSDHEDSVEVTVPSPVAFPRMEVSIREVAAGDTHCLLLAADGVYSWGVDNSFGQLGHGDIKPRSAPERIEAFAASGVTHVAQVACGRQHSLVLSVDGRVHSFGRGSLGRLGLGGIEDMLSPQPIDEFISEPTCATCDVSTCSAYGAPPRVVLLSAGLFHSLAVTEGGSLYSWGSGTNGRLGHGDTVMQLRPRRVEALAELDVVDASAGSGHSVAVSSTGVLHTWGQGYNGRLGHGNQETKPQPAEVEALFGQHITRAVAGSDFTICVTERGAAYSFGNGGNTGTMWWGRGWEGGAPCLLEPARIKELADLRIDLLAAGSAHAMLRSTSGALFTFGAGAHGQLGHGDLQEQLVPKKVELQLEVE